MVNTGDSKTTIAYFATDEHKISSLKRFDWYLANVVAGAMEHKLPEDVVTVYKDTEFQVDQDQSKER